VRGPRWLPNYMLFSRPLDKERELDEKEAPPLEPESGGHLLIEIADAHNATPRQVAFAFLVRHPVVFATPRHPIRCIRRRMPRQATSP
jgi:diketogulonate reductase-like aldo/keto reductase